MNNSFYFLSKWTNKRNKRRGNDALEKKKKLNRREEQVVGEGRTGMEARGRNRCADMRVQNDKKS